MPNYLIEIKSPFLEEVCLLFVASPRIELGSGASETLILSIVLRSH